MKKIRHKTIFYPAILLTILCLSAPAEAKKLPKIENKHILMVVASENFRDEELFEPKNIFEKQKADVTIASSVLGSSLGVLGGEAKIDITLDEVDVDDYDAVVFVGGPGASEYWEDLKAHRIAREAAEEGKIVGAICIAPVTLANAGILNKKQATVFPSEIKDLVNGNAIYSDKHVVRDGNIITADGPRSAKKFGEEIVLAVAEKQA
jgi:protease I